MHRVSILARGRAVASVQLAADAESSLFSASQLRGKLTTLMGGAAAEVLVFGEGSTGAEQDIEQATDLARDIAARYGLGDLGPVRLLAKASEGFLGNDIPMGDIAEGTRNAIDAEVRRLLASAHAEALSLLSRHRPTLDALAARLELEETLEGATLQQVLTPIEDEMAGTRKSVKRVAAQRVNGAQPRALARS